MAGTGSMIGDLTLLRPLWLLALPVIAVLAVWLYRHQGGIGGWERAVRPELLRAMAALGRVETRRDRLPLMAALGAAFIAVLALSGPAVERRDAVSFRNLDGVVLVVDASPSVTESPRWQDLVTMGRFGIASLGSRPGGMVVFAGDAYVATDLTADHKQLGQTLSLIDPETVPDPGSRPERGLDLADVLLTEAEVLAGDVVLFTDGAGLGPDSLTVAERIAAQGARLSIVAFGPSTPEMEAHAAIGGGTLMSLDAPDELSDWVTGQARDRLEQQSYPLLFWRDLGRALLAFALVPLLLLFRRQMT
ncbi:vWA domain-containing protein [Primorskyibacter marinus]|uniref:vWA domain-containing protein n=1 Tax=Primorskyibacter marinus TaxID=1977320 RepID=UPI001E543DDF|nr:VWA domain-containing protein [Primorskyibacter marinus]